MPAKELSYRTLGISARKPASLDREARTLEAVMATETPVLMWDWETGRAVPEVLLGKGAVMPRQVPLLDTHSRYSTSAVLGSVRGKRVEDGGLVIGQATFSSVPAAEEVFTKYEEGHLTDFSVGYSVNDVKRVKKGEEVEIDGRTWKGPVNVVTSWSIKELSCCPIGADAKAKVRCDNHNQEDTTMPELNERMETLEKGVSELTTAVGTLVNAVKPILERQKDTDDVQKMRVDAIRDKEITATRERERIQAIDAAAAKLEAAGYDVEHIRQEAISDGRSAEKANQAFMDVVYNSRAADPSSGMRVRLGKEDIEKSRDAAIDGLMLRGGIMVDKVQDKTTEYQTMSLLELAKNRCMVAGESIRGLDQMQIFQRALDKSDFDNILADVANKALLEGFENAEENYDLWVDTTGRVNDFKTHVFARASEAPSFVAVNPDGGEYTYGGMSDTKESVAVTDYGIIVPFTRAAMVNDDLGALFDIREKLGASARRKFGDLVWAVLTGNPTMGDGNSLFDASNHANYVASGAAPAVAGLNSAAAAMATQKDIGGLQNLNIRPVFLLAPWALKGTVDNLLTSTSPIAPGSAASPVKNPWAYLTPVHDARLDANSTTAWYLAGRKGMTVKLFTLNGNMTPVLESRAGWATDGMEFKSRITAAAKAMDYRGLYKNAGA